MHKSHKSSRSRKSRKSHRSSSSKRSKRSANSDDTTNEKEDSWFTKYRRCLLWTRERDPNTKVLADDELGELSKGE